MNLIQTRERAVNEKEGLSLQSKMMPDIKENGWTIHKSEMEGASKSGQMVHSMRGIGKTIKPMGKDV